MQQTLFFKDARSDKVYTVRLIERGTVFGTAPILFDVQVEYGPRGGAMHTAIKTKTPLALNAAEKVFHAAIAEKVRKGYTPGPDATPHQSIAEIQAGRNARDTGIRPQLLNEIETAALQRYMKDDAWWVQEKHDGHRTLVRVAGGKAIGINRTGLAVPLPAPIAVAAGKLPDCVIDGEKVGDVLWAFDLLELRGADLRAESYRERYVQLIRLLTRAGRAIELVVTASGTADKIALVEKLTKRNAEGFVLKRQAARHTPDRPNTGGDWLKVKFWESASVIVAGPNGDKSSVVVMVLKGKTPVEVGHVTVPPNKPMPSKGAIIECRYLYAGTGGRLVQPTFLTVRDDVGPLDCTWEQLKHKRVA